MTGPRTLVHLVMAAEADVAELRRRQVRWEAECAPVMSRGRLRREGTRDPWWLDFGLRELAAARRRLESYQARAEAEL